MKKKISRNIFIGAGILAIAGIFSRAIGAVYKIPLTNTLGANGMGVYYLIFPFYSLLLVLSSSGVSTAVSSIVAKERAKNMKKNELIIFRVSLMIVTIISTIGAIALLLLSRQISLIQGNINARLGYIAIAPALIFASIIAVIRAFFQGLQNMYPTSISYIVEQVVKVVFGLYFARSFINYGIEYSVFGAILGVTISELISLVIIFISYLSYKSKNGFMYVDSNAPKNSYKYSEAFKLVLKYSLPATFSAIIIPLTSFFDSFFVINLLTHSGFTSAVATSLYGINNGIVTSLINLPIIFSSSLSAVIIPSISSSLQCDKKEDVNKKCSMFIKVVFIITLPCVVFLILYSKDIIYLLYSRGLDSKVINEYAFAYKLLIVSSASVLYYGFLQTFTSILQSMGKPILPLISLCIAFIIRFILTYILVNNPAINIFGVAISQVVFLMVACLICLYFIRKEIKLYFSVYKMILAPLFAITTSAIVSMILRDLLIDSSIYIYCILTAIIGVVIYLVMIILLNCFSEEEKSMLPKFIKRTKKIV